MRREMLSWPRRICCGRRLERSRLWSWRQLLGHFCDWDAEAATEGKTMILGLWPGNFLLLVPVTPGRGAIGHHRRLGRLLRNAEQSEAVSERVNTGAPFEYRGMRHPRSGARMSRHGCLPLVLPAVQGLVARVVDPNIAPPPARRGRGCQRAIRVCGQRSSACFAARGDTSAGRRRVQRITATEERLGCVGYERHCSTGLRAWTEVDDLGL